tara:strand:- start:79 stop:486 length:408 start_codon:yes stop_codon:yes gene_type:complete
MRASNLHFTIVQESGSTSENFDAACFRPCIESAFKRAHDIGDVCAHVVGLMWAIREIMQHGLGRDAVFLQASAPKRFSRINQCDLASQCGCVKRATVPSGPTTNDQDISILCELANNHVPSVTTARLGDGPSEIS